MHLLPLNEECGRGEPEGLETQHEVSPALPVIRFIGRGIDTPSFGMRFTKQRNSMGSLIHYKTIMERGLIRNTRYICGIIILWMSTEQDVSVACEMGTQQDVSVASSL